MAGDFEQDSLGGETVGGGSSDENLIADVGDSSPGKHLVLFVPDFGNVAEAATGSAQANEAPMNSYLRLGMADSRAPDATQVALGQDLALLVHGFTDDYRDRGTGPEPASAPDLASNATNAPNGAGHPYGPPPTTTTADFRKAESLQLHTKGGWRDHSDGNRITTTRGDKVEVIRGNYKLLVLGRSDDVGNAVGYDMSGGQVDSDSGDLAHPTADESAALALSSGLDITWQWVNKDGKFRWQVTTKQGDAADSPTNPTIINQTWAQSIDSSTWAAGLNTKVIVTGSINNTTTAASITNVTAAGNISNETAAAVQESLAQIGVNATVNVTGTTAEADVSGAIVLEQIAAANVLQQIGVTILTDQITSGAITTFQTAGAAIASTQTAATITSSQQALTINNVTTAPVITNTVNGVAIDMHTPLCTHVDNHLGMHFDNHVGDHFQFDKNPITIEPTGSMKLASGATINVGTIDLKTTTQKLTTTETTAVQLAQQYIQL